MATTVKLPSFYRGDTPLLVFPVPEAYDYTGWTGYITFTVNENPQTNSDAFLHKTMSFDGTDSLGLGYPASFYYQMTNTDTESFDPTALYYWDVQINKAPTNTNNFTIASGTFQPRTDYSRGLS
jgi:hypothetical protein